MKIPSRYPVVENRSLPLSEPQAETQIQRGLYTVNRGVRLAIPVDNIKRRNEFLKQDLWRQTPDGDVYRKGTRFKPYRMNFQRKALEFLRDKVNSNIPYLYYMAVLGHDLHVATWGDLYARHWHAGWANPMNPDMLQTALDPTFETCPWLRDDVLLGFTEELGWLSGGKVTDIFVSEEIDELVSTTGTEYADFDYHEVGTSTQAENNNDTALITTTAIARATGTPTDADPIYRSVGTITADSTETWQEHGLFNNTTGAALMDRNLTGGQSVVNLDQVQYTYELTKNPEA